MDKPRPGGIANKSSIAETLFRGAALIVGMASEDVKYSSVSWNDTYNREKAKVNTYFCSFKILFDNKFNYENC